MTDPTMPAAFIGHGSPMKTLEPPSDIVALRDHDAFELAVPTPDHFIPLLYLAGLAAAADRPAQVLVDGYAMGSLSMTSYTLDARPRSHGRTR